MKFTDLLISPNVKRIYNNHFDNLRSSVPDCSLQYHTIDSKQVIVIKIHDKDHLSDLQDEYHTWYKQFQKDGLLEDVSITGVKENMNDGQGSTRYSTNSLHLSTYLTKIINSFDLDLYDYHQDLLHKFNKVSYYFRFMKYKSGGQHYPHYDSDYSDRRRVTKYSLVMYFNDCDDGELVFCEDSRENHHNSDWDRQCKEDEILLKIKPQKGLIVLFPHTLCHSVLPFTGEERNMVRGDLEFRNIWQESQK